MGDNEFGSLRRPVVDSSADPDNEMSDPLAELARLIGQGDGRDAVGREDDAADGYGEAPPARALDWADEEYAAPVREPAPESGYDHVPAAPRQSSPPLSGDAHDDALDQPYRHGAEEDAAYDEEPPHVGDDNAGDDNAGDDNAGDYNAGDYSDAEYDEGHDEPYEEERPGIGRRSRTGSVVLGIVGLIVLGSAGAFGYRAMFGGSGFPALPPIIKPSSAPIKIIPNHDSQAAAPNQTAVANSSAGDHLVSHEEQPVDVKAATPVPNAVTTIPVVSNTPDGVLPGTQPPASAPAGAPVGDAAPAEPAPPPPRPVHTLAIHTNGSAAGNPTVASERPAPAVREADTVGPLPMPGGDAQAPSGSRPREAEAGSQGSPPSASPPAQGGSTTGSSMLVSSTTGGYAVQVSSQRSEAQAEATFHALQAKYPQQLGSQHGMVRRADLGPKGIYYRTLVGPFASAEEASRLCSSLKSAGGSCIIQRN